MKLQRRKRRIKRKERRPPNFKAVFVIVVVLIATIVIKACDSSGEGRKVENHQTEEKEYFPAQFFAYPAILPTGYDTRPHCCHQINPFP